jgi:hypothetical protein
LSRRRVLAIAPDLDQLRGLVQTLESAGAEVDALKDVGTITGELPHRYIFVAADRTEDVLPRLLPHVRARAHVVTIVPKAPLPTLTTILADNRCNHVLVGEEGLAHVKVTAEKLLTGDIFGIEKYLPEGTPVNYFRLRDFQGRSTAIETIQKFAQDAGVRRQIRSAIGQVCEELLMNALYDAPVDESGKQIFAEIEPHARTETSSPRPVSIRYAATDDHFVIAVRDRFGRLAKHTILAYINKCLHSAQQIDRKTYGAGLGLYLVANAAAAYVVNVAYGMATEVVCMFDRGAKAPLRIVGVFVHPGQLEAPLTAEHAGGASAT